VPIALDFATARPTVAQLEAADVVAVLRYISGPFAISAAELATYRSAGIVVGFVSEHLATDVEGGFAAGKAHAQADLIALRALSATLAADFPAVEPLDPQSQPVYYAADQSLPSPSVAVPYYLGVNSVIPPAFTGAYGEGALLILLKADRLASWFWQSESTSFDNNATTLPISNLRQFFNRSPIPGTDFDEILTADFGQFPRPGGDVQLPTLGGLTGDAMPNWVKSVQALLIEKMGQTAVSLTGVYDAATTNGVENVQRFFGLTVSGEVDAVTWSILLGL
jgi:peptidoglycan hydrolase-like protein with peptidoglycan-binding domain